MPLWWKPEEMALCGGRSIRAIATTSPATDGCLDFVSCGKITFFFNLIEARHVGILTPGEPSQSTRICLDNVAPDLQRYLCTFLRPRSAKFGHKLNMKIPRLLVLLKICEDWAPLGVLSSIKWWGQT